MSRLHTEATDYVRRVQTSETRIEIAATRLLLRRRDTVDTAGKYDTR